MPYIKKGTTEIAGKNIERENRKIPLYSPFQIP
jgi:hypothetical protein